MKILVIFTLYLISGPVCCLNVIGYSGGSAIIYCNHQQYGKHDLYFCKDTHSSGSQKECVFLKGSSWVIRERYTLINSKDAFIANFGELSLQDAGSYQCAANGEWIHNLNLKVNTDPCCLGSKTVIGFLGETVTISFSYPEEFETHLKQIFKRTDQSMIIMISTTESQRGRFSISEDRSSRVLIVRISDVSEEDVGVYSSAVIIAAKEVSYYSLFQKIHLQVTASTTTYQSTPAEPPQSSDQSNPGSSVIPVTVGICVVLLMIGGPTLIFYKLRCSRNQGSTGSNKRFGTNAPADVDYENDPPGKQNNKRRAPVYENMEPNTPEYLSLDPRTRQADSFYHNLNSKTNQPQSTRA